jgi:hypothetical protein
MMQAALLWSLPNERYPLIDGIPILLKEHRCYLHRLNRFLETQLQKLEAFRGHPADRFWAEPQSLELQTRMIAVRAGLQTDLESRPTPWLTRQSAENPSAGQVPC